MDGIDPFPYLFFIAFLGLMGVYSILHDLTWTGYTRFVGFPVLFLYALYWLDACIPSHLLSIVLGIESSVLGQFASSAVLSGRRWEFFTASLFLWALLGWRIVAGSRRLAGV